MFTWLHTRIKACIQKARSWLSCPKIKSETSQGIRRGQYFRAAGALLFFVGLSFVLFFVLFGRKESSEVQEGRKPEPLSFETSSNKLDFNELYYHKIEEDNKKLSQEVKALKEIFQAGFQEKAPEAEGELEGLRARLDALETQVAEHPLRAENSLPQKIDEAKHSSLIHKYTLNLSEASTHKLLKTVETTIPAGAFAKTILLSGLDASASMASASDPRPILLRIIDYGTLPRKFQSDLKNCHCTASAFGDLSSERIYARLEKLTCIERKSGEIIETQVAGYIAGPDGKAGIRGIVASKDGQFLSRSLMGGVFSGLSNVANPASRRGATNPFMPGSTGVPPISMGENFASGMASGATSALDRLSQYYIDRAEQLQPVIQVPAGQVVDIVFTEGTLIGSQSVKTDIERERENARASTQKGHQNYE